MRFLKTIIAQQSNNPLLANFDASISEGSPSKASHREHGLLLFTLEVKHIQCGFMRTGTQNSAHISTQRGLWPNFHGTKILNSIFKH